jgi:hypothetical protein|tara:strand:+ start:138 stop:581 length:444 start_codon:yes stop_codon:yes gene_type:complete
MSLSGDIFDTLKTSLEEATELDDAQINNIQNISDGLANAIATFIQNQTFKITKMKASLEVEEISTTGFLSDVISQKAKTTSWPGGVTGPLQPVIIEKLNLKKNGSIQGGSLKATGNAYVGRNPVPGGDTNEDLSEVRLLPEDTNGVI